MQPLVSVICLCHNHKAYLEEAIESVLGQTYPNIEIIAVDDASTDGSKVLLREICARHGISFIDIPENIGNCAAFNKAFFLSKGKYIIDFATDDVMMPQRIENQVSFFEGLGDEVGVIFSNAQIVSEEGMPLRTHHAIDAKGNIKGQVPEGDVYADLLAKYFVSPPTMMTKRKVLEDLNGYDETLAYEDFDFWVRSSRHYKYAFQNECLMKVRKANQSLSSKLYGKGDRQLMSTYLVCLKAVDLNRNEKEKQALIKRLRYEARHATLTENHKEAELFFGLLEKEKGINLGAALMRWLNGFDIPLRRLRSFYLKARYDG